MGSSIPSPTIEVFARTIFREATQYGFGGTDLIRLVNEVLDLRLQQGMLSKSALAATALKGGLTSNANALPLRFNRIEIRQATEDGSDSDLLAKWMGDDYGRHFLLSAATAQAADVDGLIASRDSCVGIVFEAGSAIGAVAYLSIDRQQRRAELRKLIGEKSARGRGLAEEATHLWIQYGFGVLGLEKIYVSTLQTHLNNVQLNERIGFKVEGLLRKEVLVDEQRHDVLRMGLCKDDY